ncbi:asparaginase domain-containing protein [Streptomyces canus]|uniref:asparaginase n=1 Tax=Streptomyces canus TaxID=58343 RepID=UPI0036E482B1
MPDLPSPNVTIGVKTLGGTIAMTRGHKAKGATPSLTGADLIAAVPELATVAQITVEDFRQLPGASLTLTDIDDLVENVSRAEPEGLRGVATQGTDSLEETAFLADLYYQGDLPFVFTGAMRNASLPGADGPANILASAQTAASEEARGLGVLVVIGDEIHAARHVRKMHTTSITAFASPNVGPIGHVVEGIPRIHNRVPRLPPIPRPVSQQLPRVEIVTASLGSDGVLLDVLQDTVQGLVIAAFGVGHVPASWCNRLEALAATMPVVLASRIGTGSVLTSTYAFPGSESDLLARGLIAAGTLDPLKARLLLSACLAAGSSHAEIENAFAARR